MHQGKIKRENKKKRMKKRAESMKHEGSKSNSIVHMPFKINKIVIKYLAEQGFIQDRSFTWQLCFPNLCYVEDELQRSAS